jgi:hypothetical protein
MTPELTPQSTPDRQQILIEAPGPGQILLVVSDGPRQATKAIDRALGARRGWDELIRSALKDIDGALAVERELLRRIGLDESSAGPA